MLLQLVHIDNTFGGGVGIREVGLHLLFSYCDGQRVCSSHSVTEVVAHIVISFHTCIFAAPASFATGAVSVLEFG